SPDPQGRAPWLFNAVLACWLAGPGNLPLWQTLAALGEGTAHALLMARMAIVIAATLFSLLSLLSWTRAYRVLASALVVVAAFNSHFMGAYGVVIDTSMMANALATDAREVRELL